MHRLNLNGYEPDRHHEAAVAFCIHAGTDELTSPVHQHRKGQLILALHGAITCTVENALWMVPPQYAVWIPGGVQRWREVADVLEELTTTWYFGAALIVLWLLSRVLENNFLLAIAGLAILAGPAVVSLLAKDKKLHHLTSKHRVRR